MKEIKRYIMEHIFYEDFGSLLDDYKEAATRDDKLIKHKLDSIVALYDACELKEREFADEITLEFSRIIALLKNQHRKQIIELTEKLEEIQLGKVDNQYMTASHLNDDSGYEYDYEVLGSFYDFHFLVDDFFNAVYPPYRSLYLIHSVFIDICQSGYSVIYL